MVGIDDLGGLTPVERHTEVSADGPCELAAAFGERRRTSDAAYYKLLRLVEERLIRRLFGNVLRRIAAFTMPDS